jgi:WD40 repeat protein
VTSLFLSHSNEDKVAVEAVKRRLQQAKVEAFFVDYDPELGIPLGRNWERELYSAFQRADGIIFLETPASDQSKWCFAELVLARSEGKPIFPLRIGVDSQHPLLADSQSIDVVQNDLDSAVSQLLSALSRCGLGPESSIVWDTSRPPYLGLAAYQGADAGIYFGRAAEVTAVSERLRSAQLQENAGPLCIVGASGTGKSSLVRAGVLPRLRRLEDNTISLDPFSPGAKPVSALSRCLAIALDGSPQRRPDIEAALRHRPADLQEYAADVLATRSAAAKSILVVIDQAEELVTLAPAGERESFLAILAAGLRKPSPLQLLLTLRSDFLGAFSQDPALATLISNPLVLGPLERSHLPEVIEGPARSAGLRFGPGLVQRMVEDTKGGDALPMLSFTLQQLFGRRTQDGLITRDTYDALGGVHGSLRNLADEVYRVLRLDGFGDQIMSTLLKLVTLDERGEAVRRSIPLVSLNATERRIVDAFVDARLLMTSGDVGMPTVAVTHETLLRAWDPLRDAVAAEADNLRLRRDLERLSFEWQAADHSEAYLLNGSRLVRALAWVDEQGELSGESLISDFLQESAKHDENERRRNSVLLGQRTLNDLGRDPELALLLSLAAVDEYLPTARTTLALNTALRESRVRQRLSGHGGSVNSVAFSDDGLRLVTGSFDGTARVWSVSDGSLLLLLADHADLIVRAVFSPDGRHVLTAHRDGVLRIWDGDSGRVLNTVDRSNGQSRNVLAACYSPDGERVAVALRDAGGFTGRLEILSASDGSFVCSSEGQDGTFVISVDFSPNGEFLVTGRASQHVEVFPVDRNGTVGTSMRLVGLPEGAVYSARFSRDGSKLVAGAHDGNCMVWEFPSGERVTNFREEAAVYSVDFSPDGSRTVTGLTSGVARVRDVRSSRELFTLAGHSDSLRSVAFSPDGGLLATASDDATVRCWDAGTISQDTCKLVLRHPEPVYCVAFSPDGSQVVTAPSQQGPRVWDSRSGAHLLTLGNSQEKVLCAAFSNDGSRLVTAGQSRTITLWDAEDGQELFELWWPDAALNWASFSPDSHQMVVASAPGSTGTASVVLWDLDSRTATRSHTYEMDVPCASFSTDGSRIVVASGREVHVWDADMSEQQLCVKVHSFAEFVEFSPDGSQIVAALDNGTAVLIDATSGSLLLSLQGHTGVATSARFAPDGRQILTSSVDGTCRVWDLTEGEPVSVVNQGSAVAVAAYSPDGLWIATCAKDGEVRIWNNSSLEAAIARARTRVFRALTPAERSEYGLRKLD